MSNLLNFDNADINASQNNTMRNYSGVKLPEFLINDPAYWFFTVEAKFNLANITEEKVMFNLIITNLPAEVGISVKDVVMQPFQIGMLKRLKDTILSRFQRSSSARIKELLDEARFDDGQLPKFFRRLINIASDVLAYDVILQRFHERLPSAVTVAISK